MGEEGDSSVTVNPVNPSTPEPTPTPATTTTPGTITLSTPLNGLTPLTFSSALLQNHIVMEPDKVVGLMNEAVQIGIVQEVCWEGFLAKWSDPDHGKFQKNYCTTNVSSGDNFQGMILIPQCDAGNLVAYLTSTINNGETSWFNIWDWEVPAGSTKNLEQGWIITCINNLPPGAH